MIDDRHAARIARRLARNARKRDRSLSGGIIRRLWALLDTNAVARDVFHRPVDKVLGEVAQALSPDELDAYADELERRANGEGGGGHTQKTDDDGRNEPQRTPKGRVKDRPGRREQHDNR